MRIKKFLKPIGISTILFIALANQCFARSVIGCGNSIRECILKEIMNYSWVLVGIPVVLTFIIANLFLDFSGKIKKKNKGGLRWFIFIINILIFIGGTLLIYSISGSLLKLGYPYYEKTSSYQLALFIKIIGAIGGVGLISLLFGERYLFRNYENQIKYNKIKKIIIYSGLVSFISIVFVGLFKIYLV